MGKTKEHYSLREIRIFVKFFRASGLSYAQFAEAADVSVSSLKRWNRNELQGRPYRRDRYRSKRVYTHVEELLNDYALTEFSSGRYVTNANLKEKALEFAGLEGVANGFTASDGWVANFKERMVLTIRAPTHTARKAEFTAEDLLAEETFFVELEGHIQAEQVTHDRVYNFDRTMIRLVSPHPKTIAPKGVKEVVMKQPPGDKEGLTIALTIRANGKKYPAIIVFKGGSTGVLSADILSKLVIPANVMVYSAKTTWWTEKLDQAWVEQVFPEEGEKEVLVRDLCPVHRLVTTDVMLAQRGVEQVFIPPGRTGDYQPLDVSVNKPFKANYRVEYQKWRRVHNDVTNKGYLKKPGRQDFVDMISVAREKVSPDVVERSFVAAKILPGQNSGVAEATREESDDLEVSFYSDSIFG